MFTVSRLAHKAVQPGRLVTHFQNPVQAGTNYFPLGSQKSGHIMSNLLNLENNMDNHIDRFWYALGCTVEAWLITM